MKHRARIRQSGAANHGRSPRCRAFFLASNNRLAVLTGGLGGGEDPVAGSAPPSAGVGGAGSFSGTEKTGLSGLNRSGFGEITGAVCFDRTWSLRARSAPSDSSASVVRGTPRQKKIRRLSDRVAFNHSARSR